MKTIISLGCSLLFAAGLLAQTQTVKGLIVDAQSELPLIGVSVEWISGGDQYTGTITDLDGYFTLENIPIGRQAFRFSYIGYETVTLPNVLLTAGKQVQLDVSLTESVYQMDEVVVTATTEKDKANNEMATVSARNFSLEEVTRFSGGRNDVSRLAANFAGVNVADDSRNDIVIRGNSPTGVLWQLEGIPIPNPNHFSTLGTTGGPVSAINPNLLRNSDFLTSAFPGEYGNALAGVFDVGFRKGNRDQFEFTAQLAAFSGLEAMAEGPIGKNGGAFLASYRYSFVELAEYAGLDFGTQATPRYNDLNFRVDLPRTSFGTFTLFGIAGRSNIDFIGEELNEDDFFFDPGSNSYVTSDLAVVGVSHRLVLGDRAYLHTSLAGSHSGNTFRDEELTDGESPRDITDLEDRNNRVTLKSVLNQKLNARWSLRSGLLLEQYQLSAFLQDRAQTPDWQTIRDYDGTLFLGQVFSQVRYRFLPKWTVQAGLHAQYLDLNNSQALEPRGSLEWQATSKGRFSLGYGLHHQMQPLPMYFITTRFADGSAAETNRDLDFTQAQHMVLGYDHKLGEQWRLKTEVYHQWLEDVPVETAPSSFSVLNVGANFAFPEVDSLINAGSGRNYGVEMTVEKFFSQGYYFLLTGSLFDSKYTGSDGVERNTAFNNTYTANLLIGKEFRFGKQQQNTFTADLRVATAGGRYRTPIDLEASALAGQEILNEDEAFSIRQEAYFRLDLKLGYRLNSLNRKFSQQFFLDFQNLTGRKNIFTYRYNADRNEVFPVYQIGFFPDVMWRIQF
jgi:hypothetical protein